MHLDPPVAAGLVRFVDGIEQGPRGTRVGDLDHDVALHEFLPFPRLEPGRAVEAGDVGSDLLGVPVVEEIEHLPLGPRGHGE